MTVRWRGRPALALAAAVLTALLLPARAPALGLQLIGNHNQPVYVTSEPGDADRLYVVQLGGLIRLRDHGASPTTFLNLLDEARSSADTGGGSEQGLLSMAFAPDFPATPYFFVVFTTNEDTAATNPGDVVLSRFSVSADPDVASAASRTDLLVIPHPTHQNHNGSMLQFGTDGYLYMSTGDGGGGNDPFEAGQSLTTLSGKLLRIDPLSAAGTAPHYTVPGDNPLVGVAGRDEIWSYGLRNPWRFSIDMETGGLIIGDVGQGKREEIDYEPVSAGAGRRDNFGWDCFEGLLARDPPEPMNFCDPPFTDPVLDYRHPGQGGSHPEGCSIIGGFVSHDPTIPSLDGRYLYADLCGGWIRSADPALPAITDHCDEGLTVNTPTSFGQDAAGRTYVTSGSGAVSRIIGTGAPSCGPPRDLSVSIGGTGTGTVTGTGINCPGDCAHTYANGTDITLTASASGGSTFAGWTGCPAPNGNTCDISMDSDIAVTASFDPPPPPKTLTVSLGGSGTGTVTGSGINCPGDCMESHAHGTPVTLTAAGTGGSTFNQWNGCPSPSGNTCNAVMTTDLAVTASFNPAPPLSHTLTVFVFGDGTVTGMGIDCAGDDSPGDCDHSYVDALGTLPLAATPAAGSVFHSWGGDCSGTGACEYSRDADHVISARFRYVTGLDLRAAKRRVRKGKRARLTATASPCPGRPGDEVELHRFGRPQANRTLDGKCSTVFRPRIKRSAVFSAHIAPDLEHTAGNSKAITIKRKR